MKFHRDDYHLDYYKFKKGIRDDSLWIGKDTCKDSDMV